MKKVNFIGNMHTEGITRFFLRWAAKYPKLNNTLLSTDGIICF